MNKKTSSVPFETADYLTSPEGIAEYLNAALEDGNEQLMLAVIRDIAQSLGGITKLSHKTELSRESLYKTLSENGNPKLSSLVNILGALGLELSVKPKKHAA